MKRTTLVSPQEDDRAGERGSLKLFFSYAPFAGTTTAMLDEVNGMLGLGRDVFVVGMDPTVLAKSSGKGTASLDVDEVLKHRPDLVAIDSFVGENPPGSRNRYRYQDALELLHAGIDVYGALCVSNLENEADRVTLITDRQPGSLVPDYLFYTAQQVEFVDIDPQELIERSRAAGRAVDDVKVLRQLRLLALQCVSQYAASTTVADVAARREASSVSRENVVAIVTPDAPPLSVLREAMALAGAVHAPLQAVCARRDSARRATGDERLQRLADQVEAMGFEFEVVYGTDEAEAMRDYLQAQDISDVVIARRPISWARRLLLPVQSTFVDRVVEGLSGVRVHLVDADVPAGRARPVIGRGLAAFLRCRPRDVLVMLLVTLVASAVVFAMSVAGVPQALGALVWVPAVALVASLTRSYLPMALAVILCSLAHIWVIPPRGVFDSAGSSMGTLIMVASLVAVGLLTVRLGRNAEKAYRREQHTQALYELSRRLLYARGLVDVVSISLDAIVRLFGRSAVFYVEDPMEAPGGRERAHRSATIRVAPGDVGEGEFNKITEKNIAHWVFRNGAEAGSGTNTSEASYVRYLPLVMDDEVIGVIGVSARRAISMGDESFLRMVVGQILNALERQALSIKHLDDMNRLRVGTIRDQFMASLTASVNNSSGTIAELSRMLQAAGDAEAEYRSLVEQVIGIEALRSRILLGRVLADVSEPPVGRKVDMRELVSQAVERARQGRGSTILELEPGADVPEINADRALVATATQLVIEHSLAFAPVGGIVTVSVAEHPERITVSVADDRPDPLAVQPPALASSYDEDRAHDLLSLMGDRPRALEAAIDRTPLARAMRVPVAACSVDGHVDLRRAQRFDRLGYGLHIAALIVRAHNGEIKTRHRLGGGAVTSFSLPVG